MNANDLRVGDAVYVDEPCEWPPLPAFAPEYFMRARVKDTSKFKQFRKGVAQLDEEGAGFDPLTFEDDRHTWLEELGG